MDLVVEMDGALQRIQLNRAEARNSIDNDTAVALTELFRAATTDRRVRAVLVTGVGRDFCTGGGANVPVAGAGDTDAPAPSHGSNPARSTALRWPFFLAMAAAIVFRRTRSTFARTSTR